MQAHGWLIQDVHASHQRAAEGRHQVDTLAFTSAEGIGCTAERKITQAHLRNILQPRTDFPKGFGRDGAFGFA